MEILAIFQKISGQPTFDAGIKSDKLTNSNHFPLFSPQ